jgi:hypothetical protein
MDYQQLAAEVLEYAPEIAAHENPKATKRALV